MGLLDRLKHFVGAGYGVDPGGEHTIPIFSSDSESLSPDLRRSLNNAHKNPIVSACVTWLVNQGSTTPMVMQRTPENEETEVFQRHPLLSLLRTPSEYLSGRELLAVAERDMLIRGQTFWRKERARAGKISGLTFLPAGRVEVRGTREKLISQYRYRPGGNIGFIPYEPEEIVHIRIEPDPLDPKNGLPPLVALARALLIEDQTEDYTSTFLTEVGAAGGFLMPKDGETFTQEVAEKTREFIQKEFKGSKRGTLGVLRAAMQFIRTTIDPKSVGTHETHNMVVELICAVYGVHPVIVGLGAGNAQSRVGAATKELERAAWTNRVIPLQDTIAEQIGRQLLPEFVPEDELEDWAVGWNRSNVLTLQPDLFREAQRWALNVRAGIAMRYDARRAQNLETDAADKVYLLPANIVPTAPGAAPSPPQSQEPEPEPADDEPAPQERSRKTKVLLALARQKQETPPQQRDLFLAFVQNASELEEEFSTELELAFEDLGDRAAGAFWVSEGGAGVQALTGLALLKNEHGARTAVVKQDVDEDEIAAEVARILRALSITQWEQGVLIPAWDDHMLRVLNTTVGTVNTIMRASVNIPDPVSRGFLELGGTRRGLVDFDEQTRDALFRALLEGRSEGEGPIQLARRIRDQVPAGPFPKAGAKYRAKLIARTETGFSQNAAALEVYRQSDVWTHVLITDGEDFHEECAVWNGLILPKDSITEEMLLEHPNCTRSFAPITVEDDG